MSKLVIVKGIQRSGTNVVQTVLERNFRGVTPYYQHKHEMPLKGPADAPIIVCVKDPYAWLYSIYNRSKHVKRYSRYRNLATFLRSELRMPKKVGSSRHQLPILCWNGLNRAWAMGIVGRPMLLVHCENWLTQEDGVLCLQAIAEFIKKPLRSQVIPKDVKPHPPGFFPKKWYINQEYLAHFSADDMAFIRKHIDHKLANFLDYQII